MSSQRHSKRVRRLSTISDNNFSKIDIKVESEEIDCSNKDFTADFYCRICFKIFEYLDNKNKIDNNTILQLRELLQTGLKLSTGSQMICDECFSILSNFIVFKKEIIEKQAKFGQLIVKNHHNSLAEIKKISSKNHEFDQLACSEVYVKLEPLDLTEFISINDDNDEPEFIDDENDPDFEVQRSSTKKIKVQEQPRVKRIYIKKKLVKTYTECDECGKQVINLLNHKIKKHGYKHLFECKFCKYNSYDKRKLQYHHQSVHKKRAKIFEQDTSQVCPHCAKQVRHLDLHIANIHLNEKNYFCDLCPFSSFRKKPIECHMMNIHLPKSVKCSQCDFTTITNERLNRHIQNVHEYRPPPCEFICSVPECKKAFRSKFNLLYHVKRCHEREANFSCPAPECKKTFFSKSEQVVHFQNSHGPKNVICDECGHTFATLGMLRKHSTLHQEFRYKCTFENCGMKFRNGTQRKNHINRYHLYRKEHQCDECDAAFYVNRDLERHILTKHMGMKFECQVPGCTSALSRRDAYLNHLKGHTGLSDEFRQELLKKCNEFCTLMKLKK